MNGRVRERNKEGEQEHTKQKHYWKETKKRKE